MAEAIICLCNTFFSCLSFYLPISTFTCQYIVYAWLSIMWLSLNSLSRKKIAHTCEKPGKKCQISPKNCCEAFKRVSKMTANSYYFTPLPLLSSLPFSSYYVSVYLLGVILAFIIMEKLLYTKKKKKKRGFHFWLGMMSSAASPTSLEGDGEKEELLAWD